MADEAAKQQALDDWWAAWREADFTWPGLAKKGWQGYRVFQVGDTLIVAEAESREIYRVNSPSALRLQAMRLDDKGVLHHPPPPAGEVRGESLAEGAFLPEGTARVRPATLQDYWRADPHTGRLRSDEELIAGGELMFRANAPHGPPSPAGEGRASLGEPGVGLFPAAGATTPHPDAGSAAVDPPLAGEGYPPETYHAAHLPIAYADKTLTGKGGWPAEALDAIVHSRLRAAGESVWGIPRFRVHSPKDRDRRAQFLGGVWSNRPIETAVPPNPNTVSVRYDRAAFHTKISFAHVYFQGSTDFENACFQAESSFHNTKFGSVAKFNEVIFAGNTSFGHVEFKSGAYFSNAKFFKVASFSHAKFRNRAYFGQTTFEGDADFEKAAFESDARFDEASLLAGGTFANATFKKVTSFHRAKMDADLDFDGTRHLGLHELARWVGAIWVLWSLGAAGSWISLARSSGWQAWAAAVAAVGASAFLAHWTLFGGSQGRREELKEHEDNFRTLKRLAGASRNASAEILASALELKASRLRTYNPIEKFFSISYEILSDYGRNIWRPVFYLMLSCAMFAGVYWAWEARGSLAPAHHWSAQSQAIGAGAPLDPNFLDALAFSGSRILPLGPWGEIVTDDGRCAFKERLFILGTDETGRARRTCLPRSGAIAATDAGAIAGHRLAVQTLATLQSLFAIVLAFLFGLAVRRRFQIS